MFEAVREEMGDGEKDVPAHNGPGRWWLLGAQRQPEQLALAETWRNYSGEIKHESRW